MNVYLGANEIDPQTLGSLDLEGIYKGSDTVRTPAPSTVRVYLTSEYDDGVEAPCGRRLDSNGNPIYYIDVPPCPGVATNLAYPSSVLGHSGGMIWFLNGDVGAMYYVYPECEASFMTSAKYYRGGDSWLLDLSTTSGQPVAPTGGVQNGDTIALLFSSATTFTVVNNPSYGNMNDAIIASVKSGEGLSNFSISCSSYKILLGSDGYYYCAVLGTVSWYPEDARNCYVKMSISGQEWSTTYTIEDYYVESGTLNNSSFCNYFNSGDSTYIPAIASYVGDPSIVDVQTLGEYIYNKLQ